MKYVALLLTGAFAFVLALVSYAAGSSAVAVSALCTAVALVAAGLITANRQPFPVADESLVVKAPAVT
ncbi:hypothetical protein [Mycolicibacterium bacteremicum]|uniref:hypothetical protein n=1 Tax=Mycolicibacterium bacteremicum TaxID=564198 RepID=UPI001054F5DE|nr:hypothetical protein [Mycolicibacterium bacteremicum]MCV7431560.1 hypothetical protein [Mycolicibacterium bacteremicum]